MRNRRPNRIKVIVVVLAAFVCAAVNAAAQAPPITNKQIVTALTSRVPNSTYRTREEVIAALIALIRQRRVEKALTAEFEGLIRELGATPQLIAAIRENSPLPPKPDPTPHPTPAPTPLPDFSFYMTRADANFGKGMFADAISDYDKAIELKADNPAAFVNRGRAHAGLQSGEKAAADFTRAIELDPKQASAYVLRGNHYEKKGERELALADYQKAVDLEPSNESARAGASRMKDEIAKLSPAPPQFISLGIILESRMAGCRQPIYPDVARRANIFGDVSVEVEISAGGVVTKARSVSGHNFLRASAEDAARKCRIAPAMWKDKPIAAKGTIVYRFSRN